MQATSSAVWVYSRDKNNFPCRSSWFRNDFINKNRILSQTSSFAFKAYTAGMGGGVCVLFEEFVEFTLSYSLNLFALAVLTFF